MKLAHCNAMTVGVFSWVALEPEEGKFTFEWLDRVMDNLAKNGVFACSRHSQRSASCMDVAEISRGSACKCRPHAHSSWCTSQSLLHFACLPRENRAHQPHAGRAIWETPRVAHLAHLERIRRGSAIVSYARKHFARGWRSAIALSMH